MIVKGNSPHLHRQLKRLPWREVPLGEATRDRGHGRGEIRRLKVCTVSGLLFPHASQAPGMPPCSLEVRSSVATRPPGTSRLPSSRVNEPL